MNASSTPRIRSVRWLSAALIVAGGAGVGATSLSSPVSADRPDDGKPGQEVCEPLDSDKINLPSNPAEFVAVAPEGQLINEFCYKAGTQVTYVTTEPVDRVTIRDTIPKLQDLSHYSVGYVPKVPTTPPTTPTTTPQTPTTPPTTPTTTPQTPTTPPTTPTTTPQTPTTPPTTPTTTPQTPTTPLQIDVAVLPPGQPLPSAPAVTPTAVEAAPPAAPPSLPSTGGESWMLFFVAMIMIGAGVLLVDVARQDPVS